MNNSSEITDVIPISDRRTKLTARKHPPARQAWLVTTVFADALDHGGVVRDNFIRQLVRAPV